ncbi:MAG: Fe-S cluster assembly protein IscX [Algisphaera sp.]
MTFGWTDIEDIVLDLDDAHPHVDPASVRFTELRALIEALPNFAPEPGQNVNEQILEAVQAGWIEERADGEKGPGYQPNNPFH